MSTKKTVVVLIAAVLLAGIVFFLRDTGRYIPPRSEDMQLEFWICQDVSEPDWTGHDEITGWFGAREYLGTGYSAVAGEGLNQRPEVYVSYVITAWPDYADEGSFVTGITITDPAVSVYGLTVRSSSEEFSRVMDSMGFDTYI